VESRPARAGCFLQISSGPLVEEQPSIAGLVPGQRGVFLAAQMPCGTRGVVRLRLHRVAVTTTASVVLARDHALRTITTVATFAWINTNSKFPFDDGCSSCLEQY